MSMRRSAVHAAITEHNMMVADLEEAQAALEKVRELHREVEGPGFTYCEHCDHISDGIFGSCKWPCATIRALDGEK